MQGVRGGVPAGAGTCLVDRSRVHHTPLAPDGSLVTVMCGTIAGAWTLIQMYDDAYIRSLAAGATLLIIYVCLKFLGFNTFSAYQRARYSAVKILGRHFAQREPCPAPIEAGVPAAAANVSTISSEVFVDMNATGVPKMPEATI